MRNHLSKIILFLLICSNSFSQQAETVQSLVDYIEVSSSDLPDHPTFSKKQEDLYKKYHLEKVKAEIALLKEDALIIDGPVYAYVNQIFRKIIENNPDISQTSKLVLYRTNSFNAFTMGDDVIFFHVGILVDLKSESEIALVLAHELAHNVLGHVEQALTATVLLETDEELNEELKAAVQQEYGQVTALNKVMIPRILESKATSQKHEFEADSLGAVYSKNAGFSLETGIAMFRAMDYHGSANSQPLDLGKLPVEFQALFAKKTANYSRTGSLGTFENNDELEPYLRSHPYDKDRFYELASQYGITDSLETISRQSDSVFNTIHPEILDLAIEISFEERSFTETIFLEISNYAMYGEQSEYRTELSSLFNVLAFLKERRRAGSLLLLQNPKRPEDFDRFCCFAQSISPTECTAIAAVFAPKPNMTDANLNELQQLVVMIDLAKLEKKEDLKLYWQINAAGLKSGNYAWLLGELEDYLYRIKGYTFVKIEK